MAYAWEKGDEPNEKGFFKRDTLHVFPIKLEGSGDNVKKVPATKHGFKDALPVSEAVKKWPNILDGNYGIVPGPSGYVVFDVDIKHGAVGRESWTAFQDKYGRPDDTLVVTTPSGGFHVWFKKPHDFESVSNGMTIGKDIDTRADGGYVAHGEGYSIHMDKEPAEMPVKWIDYLKAGIATKQTGNDTIEHSVAMGTVTLSNDRVKELESALSSIDSNDRDTWLNVGMCLHSTYAGEQAYKIWKKWSMTSTKFDENDQHRVWESFTHGAGLNVESIFTMALDNGWVNDVKVGNLGGIMDQAPKTSKPKVYKKKNKQHVTDDDIDYLMNPPFQMMAEIINFYNSTAVRPQPLFAVQTALAIGSVLTGRYFCTDMNNYSPMYFLNIALSTTGKEHPKTVIESILRQLGKSGLIADDGFTSSSAVFSTLYNKPVCVSVIDEFGMYLKASMQQRNSHQAEANGMIMQCIGRSHATLRKKNYSMVNAKKHEVEQSDKQEVQQPCLTILASTTPGTFFESLSIDQIKDGFLGRFVPVISDAKRAPMVKADNPNKEISYSMHKWLDKITERIDDGGDLAGLVSAENRTKPHIISFSDEAEKMRLAFELEVLGIQNDLDKKGIEAIAGRTVEMSMKMAMVVALMKDPSTSVIDSDVMHWCISYMRYSLSSLVAAIDEHMHGSEYEQHKMEVLKALRSRGGRGLTGSEWHRQKPFSKFEDREFKGIMHALIEAGLCSYPTDVNEGKKGRPRIAWVAINGEDDD